MKTTLLLLFLAATLSGCASPTVVGTPVQLPDGMKVNLVTARDAAPGRGAMGVADFFTLNGKVVAYASFTWTNLDQTWGKNKIEFLWYNGDNLIRKSESEPNFGRPPHHVWSSTYPTALGAGDCRVEVHWRGQRLAQRSFKVIDATAPPLTPPGGMMPSGFSLSD